MKQPHPFLWIAPHVRGRAFAVWTVAAVILTYIMQVVGAPLITAVAPQGIVSFEMAGTPQAAAAMVAGWDEAARISAGLSLGLDYLFMAAYAGAIGLGCALVAKRLGGAAAVVGVALSWGAIVAALLDVVENAALIRVLFGAGGNWPLVARWCAIPKFVLVGAGILYVLLGALYALVARRELN